MAVALVVFDGTRVDPLDTNTDTGHWGGAGGAPSAESQNAYQNSNCVNKLSNDTSFEGIEYQDGSTTYDMRTVTGTDVLWFVKVYVNDSFDVNATFGVKAGVGSGSGDYYAYNLAGSGANNSAYSTYPAQGGYILTAINPNIAAWRDGTGSGTPDLQNVDWFGVQSAMINGNAKSENLAFDAIDIGTGLTITAGDGASDPGTFVTFVEEDQDDATVRWGCVSGSGNAVFAWCKLTVGTSDVTEFLDTDSIVTFRDGYHSAGLVGVAVGMSNSSSIIQIDSLFIGEGSAQAAAADDTRPDFVVTGTSGSFDCAATIRNFRNITFTSICDIVDADLECELLTQASANISDTVIRTNALTSVACLQDPAFGVSTDLHDVDFIQSGAGHAIELSTVGGNYTFTNLTFTGYGADTTDSAALDITAASGTTTINYTGTAPTYKTAGAAVNLVSTVTLTINVKDEDTNNIQSAACAIFKQNKDNMKGAVADDGGSQTDETTAANNATTNDMTLLPSGTVAVDDAYYFGATDKFWQLEIEIGQNGAGSWVIDWEYWDGTWTSLSGSGLNDGTDGFTAGTGTKYVRFDPPSDWTNTSVQSITGYWVRAIVTTGDASPTTQPLGTRSYTWAQLMNELSNGSGVATEAFNFASDTDVAIRIRKSTSGTTRYFPITTSGQITSSGFSLTAVMTQDDIAST